MDKTYRLLKLTITLLLVFLLAGCDSDDNKDASDNILQEHRTGSMEIEYADQFHVDYYEDDVAVAEIEDGLRYLVVPDADDLPDWLLEGELGDVTVIQAPVRRVYNAASSAMDLIDAAGGIDAVVMTSTQGSDWGIDRIRDLVESDTIRYIGKYRAPDYEALLEEDTDLTIESTMIYHNPDVKEQIESLGIPVLVERSSYESDPLGRMEWIRLYGLLFGCEDQADSYFDEQVAKLESLPGINSGSSQADSAPTVAFFSVNSNGSVVVRKPGDYVTKMIEMAGGVYALDGILPDDDNALSTMNMQMEAFYDKAVDADILIYNSTIEGSLESLSDLTELSDKFTDFRAVKNGNVWCTDASMFQKTTGAADMILEMSSIFRDAHADQELEFFHKLQAP